MKLINLFRSYILHYLFRFIFPKCKDRALHDYKNVFLKAKQDIEETLKSSIHDLDFLVLGCGYHYPEAILFSTGKNRVIGLDVKNVFWRNGFLALYHDHRKKGESIFSSFPKSVYVRRMYSGFHKHLEKISYARINHNHCDLISYNGVNLPFPNESFDITFSNATLEHIKNLPALTRELYRVTKDEGLNYHLWHNYYSLSGGHTHNWLNKKFPWGHLRGLTVPPSDTYLNKFKPNDIIAILRGVFDNVLWYQCDREHNKKGKDLEFAYEGKDCFRGKLRDQLKNYDDEVLLTRAYLAICRKKTKKIPSARASS